MSLPRLEDVHRAYTRLSNRLMGSPDPPTQSEITIEKGLAIIIETLQIIEDVKRIWPEDEIIAESFSDAIDEILFHREEIEQAIEQEE